MPTAFSVKDLLNLDPSLIFSSGNGGADFTKISHPESSDSTSLVFCFDSKALNEFANGACSILVVPQDCVNQVPANISKQALLSSPKIQNAFRLSLGLFTPPRPAPGIHASAVVHPTAQIHSSATIGPFCFVGPGAVIGGQTELKSHVSMGENSKVGSGCQISAFVKIGYNCEIHDRVILHSGVVIGSDGFGFHGSPGSPPVKVPQIGNVIIHSDVEIGANSTIDRATLGSTVIGEKTKFDNLCHVAHNCRIGKNNRIAAGFFIAGSSEVGDGCMFGGGVLIADHVKLCSNVFVGGASCITKDVTVPGSYTGYPLEPIKDGLRTIANLRHLTAMRESIAALKKNS